MYKEIRTEWKPREKKPWTTENSDIKIMTLSNLEFKLIWLYALLVKYKDDNFDRELESIVKGINRISRKDSNWN